MVAARDVGLPPVLWTPDTRSVKAAPAEGATAMETGVLGGEILAVDAAEREIDAGRRDASTIEVVGAGDTVDRRSSAGVAIPGTPTPES